eukprot:6439364-Prymnesium_polylepis.1
MVNGKPVLSCKGPQQGHTWGSMVCTIATHRSASHAREDPLADHHLPRLRRPDDVLNSDADPLVGHHALTFFQHSIDERGSSESSRTRTRAACSRGPTST